MVKKHVVHSVCHSDTSFTCLCSFFLRGFCFCFEVIHYSNDLILFPGATDCWLLTTAASSAAAASLHDTDEYIMFYVNSSCRVIYTLTRDIMHSPAQPNIVRMFLLLWSAETKKNGMGDWGLAVFTVIDLLPDISESAARQAKCCL